jgi:pimeloyl-ACP methyl ester carboxylesterase
MRNSIKLLMLVVFACLLSIANAQDEKNIKGQIQYGNNEAVGKYANINGFKMYYEEYGEGEPMFLIHGNGGAILSMVNQIDYFKANYRVIIADNRGHGKSGLNTDSLTYTQIAKDWNELANELNIDSIHIIGWSDGGIVGLLMGINHPSKVKKVVTMGANLRPDTTAVYPWAVNWVNKTREKTIIKINEKDTTQDWMLLKQHLDLLGDQPNILKSDLLKIKAPVLIVAGDKDIIREEHSVEIYQNILKAQLCILPGETHFTPSTNPVLFNQIAGKFIADPFIRPDSDWTKK